MCLRRSLENWNGHPLHFRRDNAHDSFGGAPIINYIIYHIVQLSFKLLPISLWHKDIKRNFVLFWRQEDGRERKKLPSLLGFHKRRVGQDPAGGVRSWTSQKGLRGKGTMQTHPSPGYISGQSGFTTLSMSYRSNKLWLVNLLTSFIDAWNVTVKAFCLVQEFTSY